ncbi:MAG: hypothetical protein QXJ59_08990 [Thermofilaceae archaeon]
MSEPLFAPWEVIDEERRRCRVLYVSPRLLKLHLNGGEIGYACPYDTVLLFRVNPREHPERAEITLEGKENWVKRWTCPLGCNHYRWWLHWRTSLTPRAVMHLIERGEALLASSTLAFQLLPKKYGARWGGLGGKWMP